jgi:ubiquitin-activating enzyme E1
MDGIYVVAGAICLELFKIVQDKPASQLVNSFTNLALPLFTSMEPEPPKATRCEVRGKEWKWTQWDRVDISEPAMTIEGLMAHLEEAFGVELSMLSTGVTILFSDFMDRRKMAERKTMPLKAVVELVTKKAIPAAQKYLIFELIVNDCDSGDEVEIPYLRFALY